MTRSKISPDQLSGRALIEIHKKTETSRNGKSASELTGGRKVCEAKKTPNNKKNAISRDDLTERPSYDSKSITSTPQKGDVDAFYDAKTESNLKSYLLSHRNWQPSERWPAGGHMPMGGSWADVLRFSGAKEDGVLRNVTGGTTAGSWPEIGGGRREHVVNASCVEDRVLRNVTGGTAAGSWPEIGGECRERVVNASYVGLMAEQNKLCNQGKEKIEVAGCDVGVFCCVISLLSFFFVNY
ncbi:hypothetical protein LguiA_014601 [Lonicera macranthoides]